MYAKQEHIFERKYVRIKKFQKINSRKYLTHNVIFSLQIQSFHLICICLHQYKVFCFSRHKFNYLPLFKKNLSCWKTKWSFSFFKRFSYALGEQNMIKILYNASFLKCAWIFFISPKNLFDIRIGRLLKNQLKNQISLNLNLQAF